MKKKMLLMVFVVLLVGGAAGAAWFLHPKAAAAAAAVKPVVKPVLVNVSEVTTNLSDGHYVQAAITLQMSGHKAVTLYKKRQAAVEDRIIGTLRGSTSQQLKGGKGMNALGRAIGQAIDAALGAKDVLHVYFTKLVVQ